MDWDNSDQITDSRRRQKSEVVSSSCGEERLLPRSLRFEPAKDAGSPVGMTIGKHHGDGWVGERFA